MKQVSTPVLLLLLATSTAIADCDDAVDSYNSALSDISYSLRRYANCVSSSEGTDDCSSEFRSLKSAQDDFESAVSELEYEDCN